MTGEGQRVESGMIAMDGAKRLFQDEAVAGRARKVWKGKAKGWNMIVGRIRWSSEAPGLEYRSSVFECLRFEGSMESQGRIQERRFMIRDRS